MIIIFNIIIAMITICGAACTYLYFNGPVGYTVNFRKKISRSFSPWACVMLTGTVMSFSGSLAMIIRALMKL